MKNFFQRWVRPQKPEREESHDEKLKRQVSSLYALYSNIIGAEKVILKAGKLDALDLMRSPDVGKRILGLQKVVFEDPIVDQVPSASEIPQILNEIEEELADMLARREVEDRIEKKIAEKMEERHQEYVKEIKMQIIKEDGNNVETPQTLKKYAQLEKLEKIKLTQSMSELLRPASLDEVVGQERAIEALRTKLASPYPQHIILYGPPGVGKTTAARLALEEAKKLKFTPFGEDAPFVETDGATLRWDPRDMTNPLLGSVHDPIYQGARRDLAETGVPEPKPGLATDAHGGILFIDEIGEMDLMLQNKLLKVLEDKRIFFDSAYYDSSDSNVPKYIKKLFEEGAPADFILIGATTRERSDITPAIRSRCAEIYFEPLTPKQIEQIVEQAAAKLEVSLEPAVPRLISEYTIEGRKAVGLLADAFGQALYRTGDADRQAMITCEDIYKVAQASRLTPFVNQKGSQTTAIGKIFGLGVAGYLGSVIEIEAVAFPSAEKGKGHIRFNDTAGSMAKDSVFNAAAVVRKITGQDIANFDIHINIIGGGRIDGPSAGVAIMTAVISAITRRPIRQDVAVTGEISVQGMVKAVGGVFEKAYGARQAGIATLVIPRENEKDIPHGHLGLAIHPVETVEQAMEKLLEEVSAETATA
ncbi:Lon family ATP-dependent protease [Acetonema longum]|uniref:endopeptidase La n=1 Tax=Acetonema longum DSM 6540 TaxID=1009370 RepID=F7NE34_9FIRM|nr:Lon family ATP-dependent protease [Acetonema longum]EGO65689.1 ATP-dependent protease [Acetonema longum DSM 6540]